LEVRRAQLFTKVNEAGVNVVNDLSKSVSDGPVIKMPKHPPGFKLRNDLLKLISPPSIEERYSTDEVYQKLRTAFNNEDIGHLKFEFAVTNSNDEFEMQSSNFTNAFWDTLHNKTVYFPVVPESGTDIEGLGSVEHLIVVVPDFKKQVWDSLRWIILGAALFMLVIIAAFYVTVITLLNQKKLNKIKSDFINNMTHEFKTPLATISLAVDAVKNEKVQQNKEKMLYFTGIIKEENTRMNKHVETILQAAVTEKQKIQLNLEKTHAHEVITAVLDNYRLQLEQKQGQLQLFLNAKNDLINADRVHFTNVISNLIDNAIKYSKENPLIKVTTHSTNKVLVIAVEDNGIGMSKETLKHVFEKFYRAHTGNLHDVKGFGLGMSYVKTVLDAHKWNIKVSSVLGKYSAFTIDIPLCRD